MSGILPSDSMLCGKDGGSCVVQPGQTVYYGANNSYLSKQNMIGTVGCSVASFGSDPTPNVRKLCYVSPPTVLNSSERCGGEGETCSGVGSDEIIYYGANGKYFTSLGNGGNVVCNNSTFGDPINGVGKACYKKKILPDDAPSLANSPFSSSFKIAGGNIHCNYYGFPILGVSQKCDDSSVPISAPSAQSAPSVLTPPPPAQTAPLVLTPPPTDPPPPSVQTVPSLPSDAVLCSTGDVGTVCSNVLPSQTVYYGTNGSYIQKQGTGVDIPCNFGFFGGTSGVGNNCYISPPLNSPQEPNTNTPTNLQILGVVFIVIGYILLFFSTKETAGVCCCIVSLFILFGILFLTKVID